MMIYAVVSMKKEDYDYSVLLFGEEETLRSDFNWKYSKYLFTDSKSKAEYYCTMLNNSLDSHIYAVKEICVF